LQFWIGVLTNDCENPSSSDISKACPGFREARGLLRVHTFPKAGGVAPRLRTAVLDGNDFQHCFPNLWTSEASRASNQAHRRTRGDGAITE